MYNLLKLYDVQVPSEDLVLHEDLHDRRDEYKKETDSAQAFRETRLPEMVVAVEANISKLQESVAAVVSRLDDPMLVQDDLYTDPDKALAELAVLGARLESADQLAKTYGGYQKMFAVSTFDQSEIDAGNDKFNTIKKMWETVKLWTDKYELWMQSEFTELQVEEIAKEVDMIFKDSYALKKVRWRVCAYAVCVY